MLEPRKPPIMKLVIWQEARRWIYPQRDTLKPRGHFGFMRDIPEGLAKRLEPAELKEVGQCFRQAKADVGGLVSRCEQELGDAG